MTAIAKFMEADLDAKSQWPDPWLSLNPFFADGGSVTDLVDSGLLHPECARIFQTGKTPDGTVCDGRPIRFYQHQREAIEAASRGVSYVLTTGTGSGKSLAYIVPIVDRVLRARQAGDQRQRVRAIIVYPMNALANSQIGELEKYLRDGYPPGGAGHLRALHRAGEPGRPGPDPREPAGHPADQLRDAGADAHPARRPAVADPDGRGAGVPRLRRAAHLPGPAGRGRGDADPPGQGRLRSAGRAVHRHLGHHVHRGRQRRPAARSRRRGRLAALRDDRAPRRT